MPPLTQKSSNAFKRCDLIFNFFYLCLIIPGPNKISLNIFFLIFVLIYVLFSLPLSRRKGKKCFSMVYTLGLKVTDCYCYF